MPDTAYTDKIFSDLTVKMSDTYHKMVKIWTTIGFDSNQIESRSCIFADNITEYLEGLVTAETNLYNEIESNLNKYKEKVNRLQAVLNINLTRVNTSIDINSTYDPYNESLGVMCLLSEHDFYKKVYLNLEAIKAENKLKYDDLKQEEAELCEMLDVESKSIELDGSLVGDEQLQILEQHIDELLNEEQTRVGMLKVYSETVTLITQQNQLQLDDWSSLKNLPNFNDDLVTDSISIDTTTMTNFRKSIDRLNNRRTEIMDRFVSLNEKIKEMWSEFDLTNPVLSKLILEEKENSDYTNTNVNILKTELNRCNALKRLKLSAYIDSLRDQIKQLWDEFMYGEEERLPFEKHFHEPEITDHLYDMHKKYLKELQEFATKYRSLIVALNEWHEVWKLFVDFEIEYCDPNRFKNRNYSALFEERERRRFELELPRLERILNDEANVYLKNESRPFTITNLTVKDFIKSKRDEHQLFKENLRKERQLHKEPSLNQPQLVRNKISTPNGSALKSFDKVDSALLSKGFMKERASLFNRTEGARTPKGVISQKPPISTARKFSTVSINMQAAKPKISLPASAMSKCTPKQTKPLTSKLGETAKKTNLIRKLNELPHELVDDCIQMGDFKNRLADKTNVKNDKKKRASLIGVIQKLKRRSVRSNKSVKSYLPDIIPTIMVTDCDMVSTYNQTSGIESS